MAIFAKRISQEDERLYEITVPCNDGREAYYRLSVDRLKESAFKKACKEGRTVDLSEFGDILESYFMPITIKPEAKEA